MKVQVISEVDLGDLDEKIEEAVRRVLGGLATRGARESSTVRPSTGRRTKRPRKVSTRKGTRRLRSGGTGEVLRSYLAKNRKPMTSREILAGLKLAGTETSIDALGHQLRAMVKEGELRITGSRGPASGRGRAAAIYQPTGKLAG